jgi:hypothetical protein
MRLYVGITDNDWFASLARQPGVDEANLRRSGRQAPVCTRSTRAKPFRFNPGENL